MRIAAVVLLVAVAVACAGDNDSASSSTTAGSVAVATTTQVAASSTTIITTTTKTTPTASVAAVTSTAAATTTSTVAPTTTMAPTTTSAPTTTPLPGLAGLAIDAQEVRRIGSSVEGRPITAVQRGTPGGVPVVVIGVIHGDEDDGVAILERLATEPVPVGVELWLVESVNPDGQAAQQRGNATGVDLNRNFPFEWGPIAQPGDGQYAGIGPASEPETQAAVAFIEDVRPALVLWYHQDLFRLSPGEGLEGELKQRYADLTGLPIERITGGTYTGVAATWVRNTTDAISFIVELGPTLSPSDADAHAAAVLDIADLVAAA